MAAGALLGGDVGGIFQVISEHSIAPVAKFAVAFPLTYHFLGGCRHAVRCACLHNPPSASAHRRCLCQYWDRMPDSLTNEEVEKLSLILSGAAVALSAGAAAYTISD